MAPTANHASSRRWESYVMNGCVLVFLGSGIGGVLRHGVSLVALRHLGPAFPHATVTVNVVGSFVLGLLVGWFAAKADPGHAWRLFLATGILGGFTGRGCCRATGRWKHGGTGIRGSGRPVGRLRLSSRQPLPCDGLGWSMRSWESVRRPEPRVGRPAGRLRLWPTLRCYRVGWCMRSWGIRAPAQTSGGPAGGLGPWPSLRCRRCRLVHGLWQVRAPAEPRAGGAGGAEPWLWWRRLGPGRPGPGAAPG